ncbi:MAG: hypothetical protein LBJ32_03750 [Oscillospiraceae bacterium]|jgi:hypothetical protein|nr:hypothetical protein [Oscillospiraceae bacterium]
MALDGEAREGSKSERNIVDLIGRAIEEMFVVNENEVIATRKKLVSALQAYKKIRGGNKTLPYGKLVDDTIIESGKAEDIAKLRIHTKKALKIAPLFRNQGRNAISLLDKLYSFPDFFDKEKQKKAGEKSGEEDQENISKLKLPIVFPFKMKELKGNTESKNLTEVYNKLIEKAKELKKELSPARSKTEQIRTGYESFISELKKMQSVIEKFRKKELESSKKYYSKEEVEKAYEASKENSKANSLQKNEEEYFEKLTLAFHKLYSIKKIKSIEEAIATIKSKPKKVTKIQQSQ